MRSKWTIGGIRAWALAFSAAVAAAMAAFAALGALGTEEASAADSPPGFNVICKFDKDAKIDPIVNPGGESEHLHDFFGGTVEANSDRVELVTGTSTCEPGGDRSGYWAPTASVPSGQLTPEGANVYYRVQDVAPAQVETWPINFRYVTERSTGPGDPNPRVRWTCSGFNGPGEPGYSLYEAPVNCPVDAQGAHKVIVRIEFPNCVTDAAEPQTGHNSPAAYSQPGVGCPAGYRPIPTATLAITYNTRYGENITLASGEPYTMHADFLDGWARTQLDRLIRGCVRDGSGCNSQQTEDVAYGLSPG